MENEGILIRDEVRMSCVQVISYHVLVKSGRSDIYIYISKTLKPNPHVFPLCAVISEVSKLVSWFWPSYNFNFNPQMAFSTCLLATYYILTRVFQRRKSRNCRSVDAPNSKLAASNFNTDVGDNEIEPSRVNNGL